MAEINEKKSRGLLIFVAGIMVPILAAAVPFFLNTLSPEHSLEYTYDGPIVVEKSSTFRINVYNEGNRPEENVHIWLPSSLDFEEPYETDASPNVKFEIKERKLVAMLDRIRPGEEVSIGFLARHKYGSISKHDLESLRITSDTSVGEYKDTEIFEDFLYPFGFWAFIILILVMIITGIYFEHFEPVKEREKRLLKELDKL